MELIYFPGCSMQSTSNEFQLSLEMVCKKLDIVLTELPEWSCCGSDIISGSKQQLSLSLALYNLRQAEDLSQGQLLVSCASCYSNLINAHQGVMNADERVELANAKVGKVTGNTYQGNIKVTHLLEVLAQEPQATRIAQQVVQQLTGLNVVCYYGCILKKTNELARFDSLEQPQIMETILASTGATVLPWSYKTDCCGASLALHKPELVTKLSSKVSHEAIMAGAQAIVTICPLCQLNLDSRQNGEQRLPIFHLTELLALAMGATGLKKCFDLHLTNPLPVLKQLSLA